VVAGPDHCGNIHNAQGCPGTIMAFFLPALIINILFTGCGALYLQLLAVKPKNKNSKNPVATNFVKKFKHYYSEVSLSQII